MGDAGQKVSDRGPAARLPGAPEVAIHKHRHQGPRAIAHFNPMEGLLAGTQPAVSRAQLRTSARSSGSGDEKLNSSPDTGCLNRNSEA